MLDTDGLQTVALPHLLNWFELPKDVGTCDIANALVKNWSSSSHWGIRRKETKKCRTVEKCSSFILYVDNALIILNIL